MRNVVYGAALRSDGLTLQTPVGEQRFAIKTVASPREIERLALRRFGHVCGATADVAYACLP